MVLAGRPDEVRLSTATPGGRGRRRDRGSRESKGLGLGEPCPLGLAGGDRECADGKQPLPALETLGRPRQGAGHERRHGGASGVSADALHPLLWTQTPPPYLQEAWRHARGDKLQNAAPGLCESSIPLCLMRPDEKIQHSAHQLGFANPAPVSPPTHQQAAVCRRLLKVGTFDIWTLLPPAVTHCVAGPP